MKIKKVKIIYFLVLLFIVFLSIGYSAFNVSLNIEDIVAYLRVKQDIRITGFSVSSASTSVVSSYEEYNYDKVSSLVSLPKSDSYITYRVDITNFETAEMGIYDITGLPDNLEYSVSGYTLKDKICDDSSKCNLGITKDIYITVKYKDNGYDESNTQYDIDLDFIFKEIYDVTYSGITNNGYLEYIMSGEDLKVTFKDFIPYNVVVYVDGLKLDYDKYSYLDGVLTVNEVSGNVLIEYIEKVYLTILSEGTYFKEDEYREKIKTISFVDYVDVPSDNIETYDLSKNADGAITGWIDKDYNLYVGSDFHIYGENLAGAFKDMTAVERIGFNNLNTSEVTKMHMMFLNTGYNSSTFTITGLDEWDVSNVTNMTSMFFKTAKNATTWNIGNLSNWDTSNVTDMKYMFWDAGYSSIIFDIGSLSNWDVSDVTDMSGMFVGTGFSAEVFDIGNLDGWNTSNVTNLDSMFSGAGRNAVTWNIGNLSKWDVSNVTYMSNMFDRAAYSATTFNIGNLDNWNTSQVKNMKYMFSGAGAKASSFDIGNLGGWDVSNVTDMQYMFSSAGFSATEWNIGDLSKWDVSSVLYMNRMFSDSGRYANKFNIGNLDDWNVSNVINMNSMFNTSGQMSEKWNVGKLSNWNTSKVTDMGSMYYQAGNKSLEFNVGDLSKWDTSQVTNMSRMFQNAGESAEIFNIGDLSNWNTSNVTNMSYMFYYAGRNALNWSLDLRTKEVTRDDGTTYMAWDVSNVTIYSDFNAGTGSKITPPVWIN